MKWKWTKWRNDFFMKNLRMLLMLYSNDSYTIWMVSESKKKPEKFCFNWIVSETIVSEYKIKNSNKSFNLIMSKQPTILALFSSSKRLKFDDHLTPAERLAEREKIRKNLQIKKKIENLRKNRKTKLKLSTRVGYVSIISKLFSKKATFTGL